MRESTKFTTTLGTEVVIKTYLTAREANAIKEGMYKKMKIDMDKVDGEGKPTMKGDLTAEFLLEQEKILLSSLVESIGGSGENILEKLLDLRNSEYQEILLEVNKVQQGNLAVAK